MRLQRWVWRHGSARLVAGVIVAAIFVPCLLIIVLEMRATSRLVGEMDRGLHADAVTLAYHLERLTLEMLTEERQGSALVGSVRTSRLKPRPGINPEEILMEVLPRAYTRLAEIPSGPTVHGDTGSPRSTSPDVSGTFESGTINPADFIFEIETPLGRFWVGNQAGGSSDPTTAHVQMTGSFAHPFDLGGLLPDWTLHVGFCNELKKAQGVRYLARLLPLMIIFIGSVLAHRIMRRQVDLARTRSVFVSNVSHELKTPLSAIRLYNSMLSEMDSGDTEHGEFHQVIEQEVVRLAAMIDNVLDFSHMEQGHMRLSLTEVDLGPLLSRTVQMFRRLYEDRGYHFALAASEELPPVYADPAYLQQVITNLLDNAVKYSDPHTIFVQTYEAYRSAKRFIVVHVQDQGIGIDRDKQHRIFEPFYRAESGLAQRVSGSGLGLVVAKSIVNAHGGRVELESIPGRGTTFRVLLPAEPPAEPRMSDPS